MKRFNILLVAFTLFSISNCAYDWTPVNGLFNNLILKKVIPGAVVMVGNNGSALFQSPYGTLTYQTDAFEQRVQNDTMYDVASLTKVMGTTAAIISLLDGKQIALTDLVTKYLPQYGNGGKGNTTIANLLLHNAGLLYDYPGPLPPVVEEIWTYLWYVKPAYPIGSKWSYSNLGYVLLGEIIKKVTGKSLQDYFHQSQVFMGLKETMFNPPANYTYRIAPCEYDAELRHRIVRGEAHERLSYYLGGETGHSGLFTTSTDVTRYVRLILNLGKIGIEARAFSAVTVQKFITAEKNVSYENSRGYGFDTTCPGKKMKNCFGHDGSTGAMMWADRDRNVTIVVLSNRGHPNVANGQFDQWKGTIADTIMGVLGY